MKGRYYSNDNYVGSINMSQFGCVECSKLTCKSLKSSSSAQTLCKGYHLLVEKFLTKHSQPTINTKAKKYESTLKGPLSKRKCV